MAPASSQRRLVAILAADAEGFSRHMAGDEAATVADLEAARQIFRAGVAARQGRVIDTAGDSVLAVFDQAGAAVEAACEIQQALKTRSTDPARQESLRFRIGIHLGDVIHRDDGTVYGDGVNIAARIQALARPEGIVVSEAVCAVLRGRGELVFLDRGEQRLKNIAYPVRIHAVGRDATELARAEAAAPAPGAAATRSNIPIASEPLISREAEVEALGERVLRDRLTTLVGPGGIGKTRLAGVVAAGREESFPDGVWWVDLAAVSTGDRVPQAVAQASGTPLGEGDAPALLARALSGRRLLLILDNCEHVLAGVAAVLIPLLASSAGVNVLATSQVRLAVEGEQVWRLDALEVPPEDSSFDVARSFGALRLFERRAQSVDQRFRLDAASTASAIEVCRKLDGNALAIEMAASWAPLIGLGALKQKLVERLRLLSKGNRSLPSRQQSLRATLDWSHSLLRPTEQQVLRRLSVFVGSIRLELAQQVVAADDIDEWAVLEALRTLADRSLIQVETSQPPRYRLLETVRLYSAEQLVAAGESEAVERRHGEAFASLGIALRDDYRVLSHLEFLALYGADEADIAAAFHRAWARRDAHTGAVTGAALIYLASAFGVNAGMRQLHTAACELLPAATDPIDRSLLWRQVVMTASVGNTEVPRLVAARNWLEAARALDDPRPVYVALCTLAGECARSADIEGARTAAAQARAIEDPAWPPRLRSLSMNLDIEIASYSGDIEAGRESARAVLRLAESTGDTRDVMDASQDLACLAVAAGDLDEALSRAREGVAFGRSTNRPGHTSGPLLTLCDASAIAGDDRAAAHAALEALPIMRPDLWAPRLFDAVALLAARSGDPADAGLAARFVGHADRWYAAMQMPQRAAAEARVLGLALAAIDAAIGEAERRKEREEGASLSDEQADRLAVELLERKRRPQ